MDWDTRVGKRSKGWTVRNTHQRMIRSGLITVRTHPMRIPIRKLKSFEYYQTLTRSQGDKGITYTPSKGFFDEKRRVIYLNADEIASKLEECFVKHHELGHAMYGKEQSKANKHALIECVRMGFPEKKVREYMTAHKYEISSQKPAQTPL